MRGIFFVPLVLLGIGAVKRSSKNKIAPPGTVMVNDTLYVDKTEVANIHWREYIFYLLDIKKDTIAYNKALPDTLSWYTDSLYNNPFSEYYLRHPSFNNYPVTGISYEQAVEFCKWRSDQVNTLYSTMKGTKRPFKKVVYRLLTRQEWETIAAGKYPAEQYPYGCPDIYVTWRGKKTKAFNCSYFPGEWRSDTLARFYTAPVNSFFKNTSGTYNMIGNIAEMISEKGIAKGGSFRNSIESCKIVLDQSYQKAECWLGFRCVAVVEK